MTATRPSQINKAWGISLVPPLAWNETESDNSLRIRLCEYIRIMGAFSAEDITSAQFASGGFLEYVAEKYGIQRITAPSADSLRRTPRKFARTRNGELICGDVVVIVQSVKSPITGNIHLHKGAKGVIVELNEKCEFLVSSDGRRVWMPYDALDLDGTL